MHFLSATAVSAVLCALESSRQAARGSCSPQDIEACPHEELQVALAHPKCLVRREKEQFPQVNSDLLCQLQGSVMPLEGIAPQVFEAIYQRQQGETL